MKGKAETQFPGRERLLWNHYRVYGNSKGSEHVFWCPKWITGCVTKAGDLWPAPSSLSTQNSWLSFFLFPFPLFVPIFHCTLYPNFASSFTISSLPHLPFLIEPDKKFMIHERMKFTGKCLTSRERRRPQLSISSNPGRCGPFLHWIIVLFYFWCAVQWFSWLIRPNPRMCAWGTARGWAAVLLVLSGRRKIVLYPCLRNTSGMQAQVPIVDQASQDDPLCHFIGTMSIEERHPREFK